MVITITVIVMLSSAEQPKFLEGERVRVKGLARYAVVIKPPRYRHDDYFVRLIYASGHWNTHIGRDYAERNWRRFYG